MEGGGGNSRKRWEGIGEEGHSMGASHLARGQGTVILSYGLSSMEHAFSQCLWVSEGWGGGSRRAYFVVRNGAKRKHGEPRGPGQEVGYVGKQES